MGHPSSNCAVSLVPTEKANEELNKYFTKIMLVSSNIPSNRDELNVQGFSYKQSYPQWPHAESSLGCNEQYLSTNLTSFLQNAGSYFQLEWEGQELSMGCLPSSISRLRRGANTRKKYLV